MIKRFGLTVAAFAFALVGVLAVDASTDSVETAGIQPSPWSIQQDVAGLQPSPWSIQQDVAGLQPSPWSTETIVAGIQPSPW